MITTERLLWDRVANGHYASQCGRFTAWFAPAYGQWVARDYDPPVRSARFVSHAGALAWCEKRVAEDAEAA